MCDQIDKAAPRGMAGRNAGTAEGRGRPASKPGAKRFRVTDGVHTDQNQIGSATPRGKAGRRSGAAEGRGRQPSKPRAKGFKAPFAVQTDRPQQDLHDRVAGEAAGASRVQQDHGSNMEPDNFRIDGGGADRPTNEAVIAPLSEKVYMVLFSSLHLLFSH